MNTDLLTCLNIVFIFKYAKTMYNAEEELHMLMMNYPWNLLEGLLGVGKTSFTTTVLDIDTVKILKIGTP